MSIYEDYRLKREKIVTAPDAEKQHKEGKWTARERIDYFFDPGTFIELGLWVIHRTTAFGMDKREVPAEGVITGFGKVNGREVMVASEDYTAMAGSFGEYHGKKFAQAMDFAKEKGIPFVGMNDSGGARLQEGMDTLESYGWCFRSQILGIIFHYFEEIAIIYYPLYYFTHIKGFRLLLRDDRFQIGNYSLRIVFCNYLWAFFFVVRGKEG
ncbi:Acetyl-coenzyme A carboxylase carboxyl transferase subunit beta, chloroplastic [subsurface metagenome]